jgi:ABC-type nitrate/sulfonate/bicarbonate transport system permease component
VSDQATTSLSTTENVEQSNAAQFLKWIAKPSVYIRVISLVSVLGIWELAGQAGLIRSAIFSYPSAIVIAFFSLLLSGEMFAAAYESSTILFAGLGIAIPVGVIVGTCMGRFRTFELAVDNYVYALYATPVVALAFPIAMVLGVDFVGKTTIVVFFAIMPIIINTYHGVKNVDRSLMEVTNAFCSNERERWTDLILPSVVPYLVAGLGLACGRALVGMVVAEFLMSISGLGALSQDYTGNLQLDKGLAPVVLLMIVGILLTKFVSWCENRFAKWRTQEAT